MSRRFWLILIAVVAILLYRKRSSLRQIRANVRAFDLPTAGMYDALIASFLGGLYTRAAEAVVAVFSSGRVLEVGSGPGRLAVWLARTGPALSLTGLDVSPAMVERATRRADEAGIGGRVSFVVGDVGELPFPESSFDVAVSTLSLHHWPDPHGGLAEIHRVLKPGGEALIYDIAPWLWLAARGESSLRCLAAASPFGGGSVETVRWPGSVPSFFLLRLRREGVARVAP